MQCASVRDQCISAQLEASTKFSYEIKRKLESCGTTYLAILSKVEEGGESRGVQKSIEQPQFWFQDSQIIL